MGQVYHHLLAGISPVPAETEPWSNSWITLLDDSPQSRGKNIGSRLLHTLENETDSFSHEYPGILMMNLTKALHPADNNVHPAT